MFAKDRLSKKIITFLFAGLIFAISVSPVFVNHESLSLQISTASAQTATDETSSEKTSVNEVDTSFGGCGVVPGVDTPCWVAWFVYHIPFSLSNSLANVSGMLLDWFIDYSISRGAFNQTNFVEEGWRVVRDLVNIGFIFVLLFIAFLFILDIKKYDAKRLLINLVIAATVVNFSLFVSKVIVDASNAMSHVFYNQIQLEDSDGIGKPVALGIVNKIEPTNMFKPISSKTDGNLVERRFKGDYGSFILVYLAVTLLNLGMIWIFFSVALLFVGRVVAIWLYTIFSPIAFLTYATPFSKSPQFQSMGWENWWKKMLSVAFMAPVFIFLLYLIVQFLEVGVNFQAGGVLDVKSWVGVFVPFVLIWILLKASKDIATSMSGELAGTLVSWGQKALGLAVGVAAGGVALGARSTAGRILYGKAGSEKLKEKAQAGGIGGWWAQRRLDTYSSLAGSTFDFRKSSLGKFVQSQGVKSGFGFADSPIRSEKKYQGDVAKAEAEKLKRYGFDTELADEKKQKEIDAINKEITEMSDLAKEIEDLEIVIENMGRDGQNHAKEDSQRRKLVAKQNEIMGRSGITDGDTDAWQSQKAEELREKNVELANLRKKTSGTPLRQAYASGYYDMSKRGGGDLLNQIFISRATRAKQAKTILDLELSKKAGEKTLDDYVKEAIEKERKEKEGSA